MARFSELFKRKHPFNYEDEEEEDDDVWSPPPPRRKLLCFGPTTMKAIVQRTQAKGIPVHIVPSMGKVHGYTMKMIQEAKLMRYDPRLKRKGQRPCVIVVFYVCENYFDTFTEFSEWPKRLRNDYVLVHRENINCVFLCEEEGWYQRESDSRMPNYLVDPPERYLNLPERRQPLRTIKHKLTFLLRLAHYLRPQALWAPEKDFHFYILLKRMFEDMKTGCEVVPSDMHRTPELMPTSNHIPILVRRDLFSAGQLYLILKRTKKLMEASNRDWIFREMATNRDDRSPTHEIYHLRNLYEDFKASFPSLNELANVRLSIRCSYDLSPLEVIKDQMYLDCRCRCLRRRREESHFILKPGDFLEARLYVSAEVRGQKLYDNFPVTINKSHWTTS